METPAGDSISPAGVSRRLWREFRWLLATYLIGWAFKLMSGEMSRGMVKAFFDLSQAAGERKAG